MKRTAPGRTATRAGALLAAAGLLLAGCSGGSATEPSTAGAPTSTPAATPPPLPLLEGPIGTTTTSGQPAADFEDRIISTGLDEGTAFFLAQTQSTVEVIDGHTFVLRHDFPNGATGESTYHLFSSSTMSPEDPPVFEGGAAGDEYRYTMAYAVDTAAMPAEMLAQVENGLPSAAPAGLTAGTAALRSLGPAHSGSIVAVSDDGGAHTVGVLVDGIISQGQESSIDAFVEAGKKRGLTKTAGTWDAYKTGKKVWDALDANESIANAMTELDALEDCANNPTVGLTQQEYAKNPEAQQTALKAIAKARFEIRASTGVLFSSMIADTASALVAEAPWLGFLVSPAVNYTKDSQMEAIRLYVDDATSAVVPCVPKAYTIKGTIPSIPAGIAVTGKVCSLANEFTAMADGDYVGRLTFTPAGAESGSVKFKGKVGNAPIKVTGGGAYTVTLASDGSSGTMDFPFTSTIKLSEVPSPRPIADQTSTKPARLTLTETGACPALR